MTDCVKSHPPTLAGRHLSTVQASPSTQVMLVIVQRLLFIGQEVCVHEVDDEKAGEVLHVSVVQ